MDFCNLKELLNLNLGYSIIFEIFVPIPKKLKIKRGINYHYDKMNIKINNINKNSIECELAGISKIKSEYLYEKIKSDSREEIKFKVKIIDYFKKKYELDL